jgi:phosphoribosylformylglycinamidine cyclo-ligase
MTVGGERVGLTYRDAGVDIDAGNRAVKLIKDSVRRTFRPEVVTDIGLFGGMFAMGSYNQPVLVSSVDGVGTKLKIAFALDKHDTIGKDLVNHCINDIFTSGAEALFFMDYYAAGRLVPEQFAEVVKGLAEACQAAGCALLGGETAEMPGLYSEGEYDLAGFILGVVERDRIIDGTSISVGDVVLGLPSSGLHTNGYSLARRCLGLADADARQAHAILSQRHEELGCTLGEALLEPHRCYAPDLRGVLPRLKGLAHITGGGVVENVPRILPSGTAVRFMSQRWHVPPIFGLLQRQGGVERAEMFRVFNMGIGMVVICSAGDADGIMREVPEAVLVGEIVPETDGLRVLIED